MRPGCLSTCESAECCLSELTAAVSGLQVQDTAQGAVDATKSAANTVTGQAQEAGKQADKNTPDTKDVKNAAGDAQVCCSPLPLSHYGQQYMRSTINHACASRSV